MVGILWAMMDMYMAIITELMSRIFPTGVNSPAIDTEADSIFYVATNGGAYISDYISTYSYGSPYTGWDDYAWQVNPSGDVPYGDYVDVYYSYGHLTR